MIREELVTVRSATFQLVERLRKVGDYGAGAADIRAIAETQLKLIDHLLERLR